MSDSNSGDKFTAWLEKQNAGQPAGVRASLLNDRFEGAMTVTALIGVPAGRLSLAHYIDGEYKSLYRMYEPLVKAAARKPEDFFYALRPELDRISRYVRENSLYTEFGELYALFRALQSSFGDAGDDAGEAVSSAYARLMLLDYNYIAGPGPGHDPERLVCGRSTDGEPLYCGRYRPGLGEVQVLMTDEAKELQESGRPADRDALTKKYAARYGYRDIRTESGLSDARDRDNFRAEQILRLLPYISEYTYDMLPDLEYIYRAETAPLEMLEIRDLDNRDASESLDARRRTLPANGIRYDFSYSPRVPEGTRLQSLTLKEVRRHDSIAVLFKLRFLGQDLCGYYDSKGPAFYIRFNIEDSETEETYTVKVLRVVLYLYGAATAPDGDRRLRDFGEHFLAAVSPQGKNRYPISVTPRPLGGELRNTYEDRGEPAEAPEEPCEGGENGQKKRTLQGYIRKLAPGEVPSEENKARARELGFALAEDEVYEEPFL